jgi:arabinofuranan 3-O-arabinosyltransferase
VSGVRVALRGPSWVVLGESYDRGWHASCNGHSLGAPVVINGYANGWRAPAGCWRVSFTFGPQRLMVWLYVLSAIAVGLLVAVLLLSRRPPAGDAVPGPLSGTDSPARLAPATGAAVGLAAGVVLGFIFSIRAGVVIAPAVMLICWRGIGARALTLVAGVLLAVVVPAIYLSEPFHNHGGYDFNYAIDLIYAHWAAVAAVVLLTVALARTLLEQPAARV